MSLSVCVLGSGSSGNSTVVRAPQGAFLIDAGFGPRATDVRMAGIGVGVRDLAAIVLTHLDHDHFNPNWLQTIVKQRIRLHMARRRVKDFLRLAEVRELRAKMEGNPRLSRGLTNAVPMEELVVAFDGELEPVAGVRARALALAHDEAGSHGFVLECGGCRVGFATDLGQVPEALLEGFRGVDLLAIEANYDPEMELASPRPRFLKERIMGGSGHLSNEQAYAAVRAILDRTERAWGVERLPQHIVLLHRSRQCNCPNLVRRIFSADSRIAPVLTLTHQHERTTWLSAGQARVGVMRQLAMSWG